MADRKALLEKNETPEDVATLYSWANLHGAKYRDFSASRAQTREKARQRVQDAIEAERRRSREDLETQKVVEAQRASEAAIMAEAARKQESAVREQAIKNEAQASQKAAVLAAPQASEQQQQAAQSQRMWQQPRPERPVYSPEPAPVYQPAAFRPQEAPLHAQYSIPAQMYSQPQSAVAAAGYQDYPQASTTSAYPAPTTQANYTHSTMTQPSYPPPASQNGYAQQPSPQGPPPSRDDQQQGREYQPREYQTRDQAREEHYLQVRNSWAPSEAREPAARPAWLTSDRADTATLPVPQAPEETLQSSRDRLTSRWFALNGVFAGANTPAESLPAPAAQRAPVLAVFSLAGGVGKTSLVATLGRTLSARGERVLLVDTAAYGLLPFFFGARDQRPGVLRTFTAPGGGGDAPIQMITVDPETLGPETAPQESLTQEISRHGRGASRVIVDLATASGATTRRILRMGPAVLVPVVPDMSSVVSVSSIDAFFQHNVSASGQQVRPYYVLNQFDPSLPLHLDVREVLREQLGDRLLPFALRRVSSVSEALAEGMTVVDYAPGSSAAEDFASLAAWVKSLAAPASSGYRGVRWSER